MRSALREGSQPTSSLLQFSFPRFCRRAEQVRRSIERRNGACSKSGGLLLVPKRIPARWLVRTQPGESRDTQLRKSRRLSDAPELRPSTSRIALLAPLPPSPPFPLLSPRSP